VPQNKAGASIFGSPLALASDGSLLVRSAMAAIRRCPTRRCAESAAGPETQRALASCCAISTRDW